MAGIILLPLFLVASAGSVGEKYEKSTPSMNCQVMQAAYTAATLAPAANLPHLVVYPTNVVADWHGLTPIKTFTKDYVAQLGITPSEINRLSQAQPETFNHSYKPNCKWRGGGHNWIENGVTYTTSFSEPVIIKRPDIAAIEVGFYSPGRFAYGKICIVRRIKGWWTAQCYPNWIT